MISMAFGGGGTTPAMPPLRRVLGTLIKRLGITIRHFYLNAGAFNISTAEHRLYVPAGKYWVLIGGYVTRGVCTATLNIGIFTRDNIERRRLVVLASGASDTTDIPDNVARIRENEMIEEKTFIKILFGGTQNTDSLFNIDVIEAEAK